MLENEEWFRVRKAIFQMNKPFCLIDLYVYLKYKENITDRELILNVLEEMCEEGLVIYDEIKEQVKDPNSSRWAFRVA